MRSSQCCCMLGWGSKLCNTISTASAIDTWRRSRTNSCGSAATAIGATAKMVFVKVGWVVDGLGGASTGCWTKRLIRAAGMGPEGPRQAR